ncbi:signal-regulatory protein beta-1-like [Sorex fumeus]|uniref:signal-regulatory protein beta-1-like n=1 Tax=Sorex fumeus TaxID=62283 RepID=UPI0024ACCCD1|nr:signal-regulatory protein beta-1-like [Sorex fumeus]
MPVLDFWFYFYPAHLQLTLLLGLSGVTGQDVELQVIQPDKFVSVAEGETATLRCSVTSLLPVGQVVWFLEKVGGRREIYNFGGKGHDPRVTSTLDTTKRDNLDYSIRIRDISPADMGIYYCVKFQKGNVEDVEFKSGSGTRVTVKGPETDLPTSSHIYYFLGCVIGTKVLLVLGVSAIYIYKKSRI